jgi:ATP-dependent helicase/nuclease subunit B
MREKKSVQVRFLLGPAGSGKTYRCLAEIRAALSAAPEGPPLILLAPKQATFQLERQLLSDGTPQGYTRLNILSFDRLARFVQEARGISLPPGWLAEEGRVMVLRSLLMRHENELKLFRPSARRPGFAQQLNRSLGELQQYQYTPARLRSLSRCPGLRPELQDKLRDLALLLDAYAHWLATHELQDGNRLLETATESLKLGVPGPKPLSTPGALPSSPPVAPKRIEGGLHPQSSFKVEALWLDGFAEMTPQELDLLAAIIPLCGRATLAFCLETEPAAETSWLSIWSSVGKTFQQCRQRIEALPDCGVNVETLERNPNGNRFAGNPVLQNLEKRWQNRAAVPSATCEADRMSGQLSIRLVTCANLEAEATFAAREILKFVRHKDRPCRFRDIAVLVRNLDAYHQPLARAFRRGNIPFFLDRRESVAHHPLAELTRSALRLVAFDWRHDDWFAALKAGFSPAGEAEIDRLENEALARGWRGATWRKPIQIAEDVDLARPLERLRKLILPPFQNLAGRLAGWQNRPNGRQLAAAVSELWSEMSVKQTLERWSLARPETSPIVIHPSSIHLTVWEQMNAWLDNVALAFPDEALPLREWLPISDAGLAGLTVGVIPPALDQVLIGAIDRARNPDLRLALVLGVNETVFPAATVSPAILTDADREDLGRHAIAPGPHRREYLARERYFGYIAFTRASEELIVTFSRQDADGKALNPSPFVPHLRRIFPGLEIEEFSGDVKLADVEHAQEMVPWLVKLQKVGCGMRNGPQWLRLPAVAELVENLRALREPDPAETVSPALAEKLFGPNLRSSVSRLEEFAECPFRFFVHSGLRAEERKVFELDAREQGTFQHEVLKEFHRQLTKAGKRWRDLAPPDARRRVGEIATELAPGYRDGLLHANGQNRFTTRVLAESLQDFVETLVTWMRGQYEFDPVIAELAFGIGPGSAPAWEMDLGSGHRLALRGRIDRIDLCRKSADRTLCVVMDYKSGRLKLDPILVEHGVQLQLLAYLAAVRDWPDPRSLLGAAPLIPAGVFYVNLRGQYERGANRDDALADAAAARKQAYRHIGRFDATYLDRFDSRTNASRGDQFNYYRNRDGTLRKGSSEALPHAEFEALLDRVGAQLKKMGQAIFAGAAQVDPYRKGRTTPCEFCDYQPACRIDPWTHCYRGLRPATAKASAPSSAA